MRKPEDNEPMCEVCFGSATTHMANCEESFKLLFAELVRDADQWLYRADEAKINRFLDDNERAVDPSWPKGFRDYAREELMARHG
jgi:hypothetical protein